MESNKILDNIYQWLSNKNILNNKFGCMETEKDVNKFFILLTNFELLIVSYIAYHHKEYILSFLLFIEFSASYIFHYFQCYKHNEYNKCNFYCSLDVITAIIIGAYSLYLILYNNFIYIIILLVILPIAYVMCCPYHFGLDEYYPLLHSLWHILIAIIAYIKIFIQPPKIQ